MTVMDVSARISQIQVQLALLASGGVPGSAGSLGAPGSAGSGSATAFAQALGAAGATGAGAPAGASTTGGPGGVSGEDVVAEARKYLGVPYVWGGTDPEKGLDCSGLVQLVYRNLGHELPRVSYQQATAGRPVEGGLANARPGDVLAFDSPVDHVGIYVGDGKMIEAPRTGLDVRVIDVYETPTAIRRILPDAPAAVAGAAGAGSATGLAAATSGGARVAGVPYAALFNEAGAAHGVSPALLAAVARQESAFRPDAVSPAGARGLMQLMPATARSLGVTDTSDPAQSVQGAARLLGDLLARFDRVDLALAAYNAGPGAVLRHGGVPPYAETQNYVRRVLDGWAATA